jgi:membrane associated rhomboid family serine protease
MIPLRSSERIRNPTPTVILLIAANVVIFLYQLSLGPALPSFVAQWGIIPDLISRNPWALFTSMFLHGGWLHLLGNMIFLWVFGRNIEDRLGSRSFLLFYILCGLAAAVIHVAVNLYSRIPTIGASGAIAGVMGAFLIKFPKADIDAILWLIFVWRMSIPAPFFLIYWFALQFFNGLGSISEVDYSGGGVAWFAHAGGFLAGMGLIKLFKETRPPLRAWYEQE